jgi:BirA family transcriptional regulator, biotin operon repressor / biotin---[acetyl-CoA-carboxylase] ligase
MAANPYREIEAGEPGRIGWRVHYYDEVDSTQRIAAEFANQGAAQGTVVIAELQNAGRGRMGRQWHSPPEVNLYATIILRPAMPLNEVPRLSLVAGVAAAEALETVAPGRVALKWPNDVWLRTGDVNGGASDATARASGLTAGAGELTPGTLGKGKGDLTAGASDLTPGPFAKGKGSKIAWRKAGGIISEAVTDGSQRLQCVLLGIGLNLNLAREQVPSELRDKATSVLIATGRRCDRIALAGALFKRLDTRYMETETRGFGVIRPLWEHFSALTGRSVIVVDTGARIAGVVKGIDADGALLLETAAGTQRILTGDVSIEVF